MHPLIISATELNQLIDSENNQELLLLDLSAHEVYQQGTIPGAVYMDYASIVAGIQPFLHKLPSAAKFAQSLAKVGYKDSMHIVAFDDEFGLKAARLYWTLSMAGLSNFSMLNGGLGAWLESGYQLGTDAKVSAASTIMDLSWVGSFLADAKQIEASLPEQNMFIWDARSYPEWSGEECYAERAGRIPGAQHLDWKSFLDEKGRILSKEELTKILHNFLDGNNKEVVAYCQGHRRAAMAFLISAYIGMTIKTYDGSWMEWGNTQSLPIESGND